MHANYYFKIITRSCISDMLKNSKIHQIFFFVNATNIRNDLQTQSWLCIYNKTENAEKNLHIEITFRVCKEITNVLNNFYYLLKKIQYKKHRRD